MTEQKVKKEVPSSLKIPLSKISEVCKGKDLKSFRECQKELSSQCLPLSQKARQEGFETCLTKTHSELKEKSELE